MRVIFVRHGESVGNLAGVLQGQSDYPLTAKGLEQARRVAAALSGIGPVEIVTSPLRRAAATAEAIGRALLVAPRLDPDFRECDLGDATGLTWDVYAGRYPDWANRLASEGEGRCVDRLWPNGETTSVFRSRCQQATQRALSRGEGGIVIVVAHAGPIAWALAYLLGLPSDVWPGFRIANASISEVVIEGGAPSLVRVSDVSHLQDG